VAVPAADGSHTEKRKMTVSERSIPVLTTALQEWLSGRLAPARPVVSHVVMPDTGGLSSTSVLFQASWPGEGAAIAGHRGRYVARMAPEPGALPVFPSYDLPLQFEVISRVASCVDIPLPALRWNEPEGGVLGTPFFVMDQVDGRIPLDNPPYVFTGWLLEAAPEDRARLQRASIAVLARVHAIPEPAAEFSGLRPPKGADALRHHLAQQEDYYRWALADDGFRIPIIERSLVWLEEHWPSDPGPEVLCRGDARIGSTSTCTGRGRSRPCRRSRTCC